MQGLMLHPPNSHILNISTNLYQPSSIREFRAFAKFDRDSFEVVRAAYVRLGRLRASESQWQVRSQSDIVSSIVTCSLTTRALVLFVVFFSLEENTFPSMPLDCSLSVGC